MTMTLWLSTQKRPIHEIGQETTYCAYKDPRHERYYPPFSARLCTLFPQFSDYRISVKMRWPERNIEDAAKLWQISAKAFDKMQAELGDRAVSFIFADLGPHGQSYLDAVLRRLPIGQGTLPAMDPEQKASSGDHKKPRAMPGHGGGALAGAVSRDRADLRTFRGSYGAAALAAAGIWAAP